MDIAVFVTFNGHNSQSEGVKRTRVSLGLERTKTRGGTYAQNAIYRRSQAMLPVCRTHLSYVY